MLSGGKNRAIILIAWSNRLATGKYATIADKTTGTERARERSSTTGRQPSAECGFEARLRRSRPTRA
jgi:hypothetical protein